MAMEDGKSGSDLKSLHAFTRRQVLQANRRIKIEIRDVRPL
jgi:hypothetical protein